jgi:hypothetical protein
MVRCISSVTVTETTCEPTVNACASWLWAVKNPTAMARVTWVAQAVDAAGESDDGTSPVRGGPT